MTSISCSKVIVTLFFSVLTDEKNFERLTERLPAFFMIDLGSLKASPLGAGILKGGLSLLYGKLIKKEWSKPGPNGPDDGTLLEKLKDWVHDDQSKIQEEKARRSLEEAKEKMLTAFELVRNRYEAENKTTAHCDVTAILEDGEGGQRVRMHTIEIRHELHGYYKEAKEDALKHYSLKNATHEATRIESLRIAMYSEALVLFVTNQCLGDGLDASKYLELICDDKSLCKALKEALKTTPQTQRKVVSQPALNAGEEVILLMKELQTLSKLEINDGCIPRDRLLYKQSRLVSCLPSSILTERDDQMYRTQLLDHLNKSHLESLMDIGFLAQVELLRKRCRSPDKMKHWLRYEIKDQKARELLEQANTNLFMAHKLLRNRNEGTEIPEQLKPHCNLAKKIAREHFWGKKTTVKSRIEALRIAMSSEALLMLATTKQCLDEVRVKEYMEWICNDEDFCTALEDVLMKPSNVGESVIRLIEELQTISKKEINVDTLPQGRLRSRYHRDYPLRMEKRLKESKLKSLLDIGFLTLVNQLKQLYKSDYAIEKTLSFLLPYEFHMDETWVPLNLHCDLNDITQRFSSANSYKESNKDDRDTRSIGSSTNRSVWIDSDIYAPSVPSVNNIDEYNKTINIALQRNRLTIVTGQPFYGKTTLTRKIAYDWAMGQGYKNYDLVLSVPIRDVPESLTPYETIMDMIIVYINKDSRINFDYLRRLDFSRRKLLVLLDGYDEERTSETKLCICSELHKLLQDDNVSVELPFDLLITRRPSKAIRRDKGASFLTITGFRTEKQREDYIEKHIRYSKKTSDENVILGKIRKIMEKTQKNESLRHLAESPMMLMFICLFHSKLKKGSISELLDRAIWYMIERWICKRSEHFSVLFDWNKANANIRKDYIDEWRTNEKIMYLGKIAYNMLLEGKAVFDGHDIGGDVYANIMPVLLTFSEIGLLIRSSTIQGVNFVNRYEFVHRVFQDFLAALYIIYWSTDEADSARLREANLDQFHWFFIQMVFDELLTSLNEKALESQPLQTLFDILREINVAPYRYGIQNARDKSEELDYLRKVLRQCTNQEFLQIWRKNSIDSVDFVPEIILPEQMFASLRFYDSQKSTNSTEEVCTLKCECFVGYCTLWGKHEISPDRPVETAQLLNAWSSGAHTYIYQAPLMAFFSSEMEEKLASVEVVDNMQAWRGCLELYLFRETSETTEKAALNLLKLFNGVSSLEIRNTSWADLEKADKITAPNKFPALPNLQDVNLHYIRVEYPLLASLCTDDSEYFPNIRSVLIENCQPDECALEFLTKISVQYSYYEGRINAEWKRPKKFMTMRRSSSAILVRKGCSDMGRDYGCIKGASLKIRAMSRD